MTYRIHGLPLAPFRALFDLSDAELEASGARRIVAGSPNSAPCRVSLIDAEPGERLVLVSHRHLDADASPYRSEGPIFVREAAAEAMPVEDVVPDMLAHRLLSARAYDPAAMMIDAEVMEGGELDGWLRRAFSNPDVDVVHVHTARRGCYLAEAARI